MEPTAAAGDIAGKDYWEAQWGPAGLPPPIDPRDSRLGNHVRRRYHALFERLFPPASAVGNSLLEIGCARSAWLPYFAREHGFRVCGLDYSASGCALTRRLLEREGVDGEVACADLFDPPAALVGRFDVVVSFGVVEHFRDTAACLRAAARLAKPGGRLITSVPNLAGLVGTLQRRLNRPVFDKHVPLDREALREAHCRAGLAVEECGYFVSTEFGVCNLNGVPQRGLAWPLKRWTLQGLSKASAAVWLGERLVGPLGASRLASPYVVCVAAVPRA